MKYLRIFLNELCINIALADCGEPESPTNGIVDYNSTVEGSTANYRCNEGYILVGIIQRVCNDSGQWLGGVPECQRKLVIITKIV